MISSGELEFQNGFLYVTLKNTLSAEVYKVWELIEFSEGSIAIRLCNDGGTAMTTKSHL